MFKTRFLAYFILCSHCLHAAPITWVAPSPNNDMEDPGNWDPNTVPGSADEAVFDSSISGISFDPTENLTTFFVSDFNFLNLASPFTFSFNNQSLVFSGIGITGAQTNTALNFNNTSNIFALENMLSFASAGTMGSANVTCSNTGSVSGAQSGQSSGLIGAQVHADGAFIIADNGIITASNTGFDTASDLGGNSVAIGATGQLHFNDSFSSGDEVSISVENTGFYIGSNSSSGDLVGIIQGHQFVSVGAFTAGDNFNCTVENVGIDSSSGIGSNQIGVINASQMGLQATAIVGDDAHIEISNGGFNSASSSGIDQVAYLNDNQLFVGDVFQAGEGFELEVSNSGNDSSTGNGQHQVAVINSNSGTSGDQVLFLKGAAFNSDAFINVTNNGTYIGTNTAGGSQVAIMNLGQFAAGDSTSIGSHNFNTADHFTLMVSNSGTDSAQGFGGDAVGVVSTNQVAFFSPCALGEIAKITISNDAQYSGSASNTYVNVGSVGSHQFNAASTFQTGSDFTLQISNSGTNQGSGIGGYFIGDIITAQQAVFEGGLNVGDFTAITITNAGTNSASTTNQNQVGSLMGYGVQLLVKDGFNTGKRLDLVISNTGFDNSSGSGGNYVGFINNNTANFSASQFHLDDEANVGNNANITISNTGTLAGNNSGSNIIATLAGPQFASMEPFEAGSIFHFNVSNAGTNNSSGQSNNSIGVTSGSQVDFESDCAVGNGTSIVISNAGTNHDVTGTNNSIGYVTDSQMKVVGDFFADTALNIQITNSAVNDGDSSNFVGYVANSQLSFQQTCTLQDFSTINVINSGTVGGSQILFSQGFDILNGKATISVTNEGDVAGYGIEVQGSNAGGNAEIVLNNSSLHIATTLPNFIIAGLSGDETSTVQSQPTLIINRDNSIVTEFSGDIQDFSGSVATRLIKTGPGTQILSGTNTYTGFTTIEEGVLIVNGSIADSLLIKPSGTLKGTGTIFGTVTNRGTISPGQSIGVLTFGDYINDGGTYDVEINGAGQSDLIHSLGTARLIGGTVAVTSLDNAFQFFQPYTIVTADTSVTGTYSNVTTTGLSFITPILTYDPNHVYLTIRPDLCRAAEKCNQIGVAENIDNHGHLNAARSPLINAIVTLPLEDVQQALESLSGFQYTNEVWATEISTSQFLRRLYDPLRSQISCCGQSYCCHDWTTWLETGSNFSKLHGNHAHSTHIHGYQITGGVQKYVACNFLLGLAGSYEHDHARFKRAKANRNSGFVALYGLYRPSRFYTLFDVAYGHTNSRLTREIKARNIEHKASGHPNVNTVAFYAESGFDCGIDCFLFQPFIALQAEKNWRSKVREENCSGWGLAIAEHEWAPVNSRLGFHLSTCNLCKCVDVFFDLAWNQRLSSKSNSTKGHFRDFGHCFDICGNKLDNSSVDYSLTLSKNCECFDFYIEWEGQRWRHASTNSILAGLKYSW